MESATYEDQFGRVARRLLRVYRPVRRRAKRFLGVRSEILVEIRWHVGDEIMAIPIYEALRATYSPCRITVLCNHPELLEGNPFVDALNEIRRDPDRYIFLRSGPRHVYRLDHYARCAGIGTPDIRPRLYYSDWSAPLIVDIGEPFVAVCADASWATKRWPIERWRVLSRALSDMGYAVVELGTGDEPIGVGQCMVNKTNLREAACVLRAARLLICCDSGLMHLALAAGGRVLALFGPTDPDILVRNEPRLTSVVVDRDCRGCWNREVNLALVPKFNLGTSAHLGTSALGAGTCPLNRQICLDAVTAEQVIEQARRILDPPRRGT